MLILFSLLLMLTLLFFGLLFDKEQVVGFKRLLEYLVLPEISFGETVDFIKLLLVLLLVFDLGLLLLLGIF